MDGSGNVYVGGYSSATWGTPVRTCSSGFDMYGRQAHSSGGLTWNTFLGGSGNDYGQGHGPGQQRKCLPGRLRRRDLGLARAGLRRRLRYDAIAVKLEQQRQPHLEHLHRRHGTRVGYEIAVDGSGNVLREWIERCHVGLALAGLHQRH